MASRPGRVAHHRSTARRIGSADGRNRGVTHAEPAEDAFGTAHAPGTPVEPPSTADRHRLRHPHSPDRPRDPAETHRPTGPDHSYRSDHSADPADTQPSPSADPSDTFALIDDLLAHVRRHRPTDAFDELARHRLLERRALLERHADRRPPPGGSVGWVHGDFHPFNVLYKGDSPAAIVDWDRLGVRPRAEEAVRAAAIFFVQPAGTLDLPKIRAYARAYRRTAGATPSELAAAVHRVWWERLNDFWMLRWHYERGDTRADSQFPAASALAVWWTREYDTVCEAFVA
ncbi:phosphotransferase [Streptomyces sp. ME02-8801-2C]|nr:phosphotransferase [Streptomyces sp. ME02-8801-2C]MDX3454052.1 phosphotransferase [Streptomyces sp. ME02-8801-2C]